MVGRSASDALVGHAHCAICCHPPQKLRAYYRRPTSLTRCAGQHGCRRRRRRTARHRHAQRVCWRPSCSCLLFLLRPARGWLLRCRRYTIRVRPGRYVRRRLLCSLFSWPYRCRRGWQRWHTPSSWRSRRSLRRPRGLRGGAALILTCAALACIGARFISLRNMCHTVTLLLVGARLASNLVLADLVATCWPTSRSLLRLGSSLHFFGAFLCRYIRTLHAMLLQTSLFLLSRASWGPNSPGGGGFMLFLLFLLVQPCQAVSAAPKPRVVEASTTSTGAAQTVSPCVTAVAKPCELHGLFNAAQKRAFRRARNRVAQAGPDGHTWYRGRRCSAADLGLIRSSSSLTAPFHSTRARHMAKRTPLPRLHLPAWPPTEDTSSALAAPRRRGLLSVLSLNLGGLTQHGYDELCTWLHTPALRVRDQVDVICLQETWRLGSEYLLPDWFWISSGSAPVSGQGIAVLVNRRFVPDQTIRFREVQIGRLLHVVVPLQHSGGSRSLDIVCAYIPSKVSESQSTYDRRDKSWTLLDRLLESLPRRNMLYVAGDFNTDLHLAPPFVGVSYDIGTRQRYTARDQPRFQHMLAQHQLCALNTWRPEATYRDAQGHASRVDFILTRFHQARGRRINIFPHVRLASWRASEGHVLLGGYISIDVWRMAPAARAPSGHDRDALCKACFPGLEHDHLRQVFHAKAHLFQPQLSPVMAEKLLLDVCQEAFPRRAVARAGLPWQLPEVKSDLRRVWQLRCQLQRTETPRRSTALRICFAVWCQARSLAREIKQLKARSKQRRREVWMQRLAEGEKALARQDTYALFQVIQDLAPRRNRERVQIRDSQGHVLIPEAETLALVRYWSGVFCQGSDARPPRHLQQALHLTRPQAFTLRYAVLKDAKPLRLATLRRRSGRRLLSLCRPIWQTTCMPTGRQV